MEDLKTYADTRNVYSSDGTFGPVRLIVFARNDRHALKVLDEAVDGRAAAWGPNADRRARGGRRRNRKPKAAA